MGLLYSLRISAEVSFILVTIHTFDRQIDGRVGLGWARFYVPLDTFLGHFGDGAEGAASGRIA